MRLFGFFGLALLCGACGVSPANTSPSTYREFVTTANQITCEARLRCCGSVCSDGGDEGWFKNHSRIQDYIAAGLLRYDASAAAACLATEAERNKVCDRALTEVPNSSNSCSLVVVGNAPAGGLCDNPNGISTCSADTFCSGGSGGTCMAKAKVGESCTTVTCVPAAFCDSSMGAPTCKARIPAGQACTSSSQCMTGAFCDATLRVCTDYSKAGQPCSGTKPCDPLDTNLSCLPSNVCGGPQNDGASCTSGAQCKSGRCNRPGTEPGTCQPHPTPRTFRDSLCSLT